MNSNDTGTLVGPFNGKKLTSGELRNVLDAHRRWVCGEADGVRADLRGAKLPPCKVNLPSVDKAFTCYKKVCGDIILELSVPADAERTSSLIGRKCRASEALTTSASRMDGTKLTDDELAATVLRSLHRDSFIYKVGQTVKPDWYDGDIRVECTHGVHFFETFEEARAY